MTRLSYTHDLKHLSSKRCWAALCLQRPGHEWLSLQQDSTACLDLCHHPSWDKPLPELSSLSHWQKVPGDALLEYQSSDGMPRSFCHHEPPQHHDCDTLQKTEFSLASTWICGWVRAAICARVLSIGCSLVQEGNLQSSCFPWPRKLPHIKTKPL